jgi:hypothetical protein
LSKRRIDGAGTVRYHCIHMAKKHKALWAVLIALALVIYSFYSLTGITVIPPRQLPPDGMTAWYYRRGTGLPFLSSPDGQRIKAESAARDATIRLLPDADRVLLRFPFNKDLYLRTTGGVEFVK